MCPIHMHMHIPYIVYILSPVIFPNHPRNTLYIKVLSFVSPWSYHCSPFINIRMYGKSIWYEPLIRYITFLWVAHAPGIPGTFSPPSTPQGIVRKISRHASCHVRHARTVMHIGIAKPRWRGKRSRHSRRMRNPRFYVSGKRSIGL